MPIIIRLDVELAKKKMKLTELSEKLGISIVNLSNFKTGKIKVVKLSTLEGMCEALQCQPGDIIEYKPEEKGQP
ncbi:MAG: helix-turn-helix transcriptional regulator [Candidatus Wallbacteria bacterium]|nr:helix-turn-helix transcriptional regulator [Candidatus Wallbacteria bacterium]